MAQQAGGEPGASVDFKVVLLGMHSIGKTCLFQRFLHDRYSDLSNTPTIGASYGEKTVVVDGRPVKISLWDTAGSERYESMTRLYYRSSSVALVCFDLTSAISLQKVQMWANELRQNEPKCAVFLVGTKLDLIESGQCTRAVTEQNVRAFAQRLNVQEENIFETSAQSGKGVKELFDAVAKCYVPKEGRTDTRILEQQPTEGAWCSC